MVLCLLPGCGRTAQPRGGLGSPNPLDRAESVVEAAEARDHNAIHALVDLLDDPDPAVRMYAQLALQRLCGRDYGYRYYHDEARRAVAVQRWRDALRDGKVSIRSEPPVPIPADVGSPSEARERTEETAQASLP